MAEQGIKVGPIVIAAAELKFSYIRASGPGGQNVNKVSTAAQLRFEAAKCKTINSDLLKRLREVSGQRMTSAGVIVLTAQRFRSQERNREDAIFRLTEIIRAASRQNKFRRPTKMSKRIKRKRLDSKRRRSNIKINRRSLKGDD
ncbi:MAG: aminoacyl-tRNA hydrolase [Rhodospirillaceae bacterium]|nr:aminoacyl-tRNA hydrolase [Rhodospirillaceae bacterium]